LGDIHGIQEKGKNVIDVNGVYTQRYNRKHGEDGPLFRGRFKSVLVQDNVHLPGVVRYIHLNPIKPRQEI